MAANSIHRHAVLAPSPVAPAFAGATVFVGWMVSRSIEPRKLNLTKNQGVPKTTKTLTGKQ